MNWIVLVRLLIELVRMLPKEPKAEEIERQLRVTIAEASDTDTVSVASTQMWEDLIPHIVAIIQIFIAWRKQPSVN